MLADMSMDIPWGSEGTTAMVGNVGLITSRDESGKPNIMAAEWTRLISYTPALFAVHIGPGKKSLLNILETKVFGISITSKNQGWIASVAGGSHGDEENKVAALKELGVKFREDDETKVLLVEEAALQVVCRMIKKEELGDHVMVVGSVENFKVADPPAPIVYHKRKYYDLTGPLPKPETEELERIKKVVDKYRKSEITK